MKKSPEEILESRQARANEALSTLWRNDESRQIGPETALDHFTRIGLESYRDNPNPDLSELEITSITTTAILKSVGWRHRVTANNRDTLEDAARRVNRLLGRQTED